MFNDSDILLGLLIFSAISYAACIPFAAEIRLAIRQLSMSEVATILVDTLGLALSVIAFATISIVLRTVFQFPSDKAYRYVRFAFMSGLAITPWTFAVRYYIWRKRNVRSRNR